MSKNTSLMIAIGILAAAVPLMLWRAYVVMLIYNGLVAELFNTPRIPSVWWAAAVLTITWMFTPLNGNRNDKTQDENLRAGCTAAVIGFLAPLFALAFAWLFMQLGGIQ